jgi:cytochrome c
MSAIGLPGPRLQDPVQLALWQRARLYGLPEARQTGYLCAAASAGLHAACLHIRRRSFEAMNSFELNKILGAILGTCLIVLSINIAAGAIFAPKMPAKPGYDIAVPEHKPGGEAQPQQPERQQPEPQQPIEQLLANADVKRGESAAKKCAACHTFNKGGRPLVGPNLWGVVGRPKASQPGFNYSAALKAKGGNWTIDDINQFITNPKGMVPGTNMTFAGDSHARERADIIAYLNSLSDSPAPLPTAAEASGSPKPQ